MPNWIRVWSSRTFPCRRGIYLKSRQGQEECGAVIQGRLDPNAAAMARDDLFHDCQTHTGAWIRIVVNSFENAKNSLGLARIDPDPVVAEGENHSIAGDFGRHMNLRPGRAVKFDRIVDQAGE